MRIIQLIYSLCSGGAERFVVSLSNQLVDMGHEVTVCMLLPSSEERYIFNKQYLNHKVKFHSMGFGSGCSLNKVKALEKYLIAENPDIVHCHLNVIPYIFRLSFACRSIRFVHTLHSVAENASGKKYQRFINRWFYSQGIITPVTISEQCRLSYVRFYGLPSPVRIDNGCETPHKTSLFDSVKAEVDSYKSDENTPVFIHVARYHEQKNQGLLIDAFNELDREETDFVLLILGDGFEQGRGAELKDKACRNIHFLGLKNNVADYLYCSDAFCLTSIYEGLPISLLEAMACGVVPICTKVGGVADVIEDGVDGYLSKIDKNEYLNCIHRYLSSPILPLSTMAHFNDMLSISKCAFKYFEVYNNKR